MRKKKKALKQRPYNFDYDLEFDIYKQIEKKKKGRKAKAIEKQGIEIPNKYSAWKAGVIERYPKLINNEDFFHFLKSKLRGAKSIYDKTITVTVPIEVGVMTLLVSIEASVDKSLAVNMVATGVMATVLVSALAVILSGYEKKKTFDEDLIEVLCPKYADKS
jgi:hypothetical protein